MAPVSKKMVNGKPTSVRICVYLKRLTQKAKREKCVLNVFHELSTQLAGSIVFSNLDAAMGFGKYFSPKGTRDRKSLFPHMENVISIVFASV